ncbi:MAG: M56 family metallopeptidase, partial [Blautia sp.]|uniref:M56 family metallopeptidase n=1 Tax=Blautia sp. TaxID=1955243 RepID=UPI002E75C0E8
MNNLLLFMSISGTVAFGMYFLCRNFLKEKLAPGYRYILLKLIMLFYLLPVPLLSSNIRKAIGRLYGNEALINGYAFGKNYRHLSRGKFFYIIDKQTMIPDYRGIFWICVIVWGGMCALYLGNFVYHKIKLKKIRQYAVGECGTVVPYLNKEYEMIMHKHRVRIVFMPMHTEAFTYGFFSSVIVIPADLDSEAISYVLKHELTHIRRRDIWINFFAYLAVAIHFYNPFIYLFYKEIMKTAELSCDEQTLKNADREERVRYGHMLIEQA